MAKLYFKVASDWEEVVRLRNEIAKLKQELKTMDGTASPAAFKTLNTQLSASTQRMDELVTEAAKAGAVMEGSFKKKIFDASQTVNGFTEKIIAQKAVVKDIEADVRRLGEAYRTALKSNPLSANSKFAEYKSAKRALEEEKAALFGLTQEQANARLSVKKLRDEYTLYKNDGKQVVETNQDIGLSLGKALGVIGGAAALKKLGSEIIRVRGEFQSMQTAIETMVGKDMAGQLIPQIKELAKISPLTMTDMVGAEKMMLGFNIQAEDTIKYLKALSDISMGESSKFNSLTLAFSQMSATGKLMGQDLNQMINAGFNPLQVIAEKTGKSIVTLKDEMSKGAVSAEIVQQAFIDATSAGGKFYEMSENASKTINGQISMMQDAWDNALNEIGKSSEGFIMSGIKATTSLIQNYETIGKVLVGMIATYGVYKTALITNIALTEGWAAAARADSMAKGIQTIATKAQTVAQLALNSAMKANPYVLTATLIVGVASAMWALHDSTTAAEKGVERYNEEQGKAARLEAERKQKIDGLVQSSRDIALSDLQRGQSLAELRKEYPKIFAQYDIETIKLADILKLKQQIAEEDAKRVGERVARDFEAANKAVSDYETTLTAKQINGGKLTQQEINKLKELRSVRDQFLVDRGSPISEQFISNLKNIDISELDNYISELEKQIKGKGEDGKIKLRLPIDMKGSLSDEAIYDIKDIKTLIDAAKTAKKTAEDAANAEKKSSAEWLSSYKKAYEDADKAYNDFLKSKTEMSDADRDKELKRLKGLRDAAKSTYESKGGIVSSSSKQESVAEKLRKEQEAIRAQNDKLMSLESKQALERQRQQQDLENQAAQAEINALADGYEKEKAQRDLNNKMELESLERQKEDYIQKVVDMHRQIFEAEENAKAAEDKTYQKKTFDTSSVSVDTSIFNKMEQNVRKKQVAETAKYYNDVLSKYQDYATKRLNAQKQFDADRERLVKSGASDAQLKELEYQRDETYKAIDNEFAMREDSFQSWADGIANISLRKLSELLVEAERELERMEFITPNNPKLAQQRAKVTTLKNTISDKENDTQTNPNERSNKEWQELYKTLTEVENQFDEIGNTVGGTAGDIISSAGKITASTLQMINGIVSFGEISAENITGVSATTAQAIASVEKASVILAIIGAALQIASKIASLFKGTDYMAEFRKEMEKLNYELELAKLNAEISTDKNSIFGDDLWANAVKNIDRAQEALGRYNETLDDISNRKKYTGFSAMMAEAMGLKNTYDSLGESIADMQVKIRHKTWFRSAKYSSLKDAVPELFNDDGSVNQTALEEFIGSDTFGKLSEENQQYLQKMSDYWKSYQDAVEKVKDYLTDIFGDLGNTMNDALVDAFANGTDAAQVFTDSVSNMLETLAKQMVYAATLGPLMERYQEKLLGVMNNTSLSKEEQFKQMAGVMEGLVDEAIAEQGYANELLEKLQQAAAEKGFDIFVPESVTKAKEALESFVSSMQSAFTSLDVTAKDVSDNIYDYFRQAMINALYEKEYKGKMEELYKTFEELSKDGLSEGDMAQLGSQIDQYIEQMMKGVEDVNGLFADKLKDAEDIKSFVDNVKSAMSSIEATAEDVTDNIFEYIRQQMIDKMFADTFQPQIEAFYKKVQEAMSDGDITDSERDALRAEAEKLANDITAAKDILSDTLGITEQNLKKELEEEFKSFSDGVLNSLYDAEVTAEAVTKNISDSMRKELIEAMYIEQYEPRIKAIWEKWKEYSEDGLVTDEERANIKNDIDELSKEVADAAKEISDAWKDSGAEVKKAFDSFSDSIKSVLYDAETTAEDVANNIYKFMRNALVDSMFAAQLQPQIQAWYDQYNKFMEDGAIDTVERKTLDEMIAEIQKAGMEIVDVANGLFPSLDTGAIKHADEAEQEWESFSDGILNSLYDIEATAEDISDDMSEYMRKALIKAMYIENFKPQMQKWYNAWKSAMGDDNLTSEEKQMLDSMKQTMVDDMKKEVDAINQFFGSMFSQQASSKGFEGLSQDTGEELNGRFTALQIAGEEIRNQAVQQTGLLSSIDKRLSLLDITNDDIPALMSGMPNFADKTRGIITNSYQPQANVVFPTEDIKVLAEKVSSMERIVDEMRTFQVEGNMARRDILENSAILAKNSPKILAGTDEIKRNLKNL